MLKLFSRSFLRDPRGLFSLLDDAERSIFVQVYGQVEQFKREPQAPLRYEDFEEFAMSMQEFVAAMLAQMSPEDRLRGLSPEERLKGLAPEEWLRGVSPEDLARGLRSLPPEAPRGTAARGPEHARGLGPDWRRVPVSAAGSRTRSGR